MQSKGKLISSLHRSKESNKYYNGNRMISIKIYPAISQEFLREFSSPNRQMTVIMTIFQVKYIKKKNISIIIISYYV